MSATPDQITTDPKPAPTGEFAAAYGSPFPAIERCLRVGCSLTALATGCPLIIKLTLHWGTRPNVNAEGTTLEAAMRKLDALLDTANHVVTRNRTKWPSSRRSHPRR